MIGVAVRRRRGQQVLVLGPHTVGVAVRHRREEQEPLGGDLEPLLADAALAQQYRLPAIEQCVHRRAPLLQRGPAARGGGHAPNRARTSGRRNGGTVFGGCLRSGNPDSRCVVVAVTSATAASNASTLAADGLVIPLTLRMYWRAAAPISPPVGGGAPPRKPGVCV